jgi:lipopolysaccharide/colanic/teichoic acid biosynthesis glycosyltransferase
VGFVPRRRKPTSDLIRYPRSASGPALPYPVGKQILDKSVATLSIICLLPVFVAVLATILVDMLVVPRDRGTLLYREPRISRGRTFGLLKFRTLRANVLTEAQGHARPLEADRANLTWAGRRLLKPWYLDELPQLFNVLRGDISLVGPRPWPPALVERQAESGHDYRNRVIAGLTGPAQVTKGSRQPYEELDLQYVQVLKSRRGLRLVLFDLEIMRRTIATLARGEGLSY